MQVPASLLASVSDTKGVNKNNSHSHTSNNNYYNSNDKNSFNGILSLLGIEPLSRAVQERPLEPSTQPTVSGVDGSSSATDGPLSVGIRMFPETQIEAFHDVKTSLTLWENNLTGLGFQGTQY